MAGQEPEDVGRKGGAAEGYMGAHPAGYHETTYYEPTVTAVTDIVVPATRIQWGPVFAGILIALSVTFLWTGLGIALALGTGGLGYWIVGFASLGLFLGSMFAARTAKADVWPAVMHAVIIWAIIMIGNVFLFGSIGAGVLNAVVSAAGAGTSGVAPGAITSAVTGAGWWFFGGFLILLAASILGGLAGINPPEHDERRENAVVVEHHD